MKPAEERAAFLEQACHDNPALRAEVDRRLAELDSAITHRALEGDLPTRALPDPYQLIGTTIGHYKIRELLGKGGMGVVYRADDTRLHRTVALKFLRLSLSDEEPARERFFAEARAASALDHHNVCNIHEFGETDGGHFYLVMAYYEGRPLSRKIGGEALPLETAVDFALQIASGLAAAHERGVLHRDLKPANVMITPASREAPHGVAKILDFGLAKMEGVEITETGTTLGTVAYMSPEQARGDRVDARSDLWSLGVILYEMLTGKRPFTGKTEFSTLRAVAADEAVPPTRVNPEIPGELESIVLKCLAKDPGERYDDVGALLAHLQSFHLATISKSFSGSLETASGPAPRLPRSWLVGGGLAIVGLLVAVLLVTFPASRRSASGPSAAAAAGGSRLVAVLPFVNSLGPSAENQALADGLTHSVTGLVARLGKMEPSLWIVPSNEIFQQRITTASHAHKYLGVNTVLTGSVQRLGTATEILISVVNPTVEPPRTLDSRTVTAPLSPALIAETLAQLASLLDIEATIDVGLDRLAAEATSDSAYALYLQGIGFLLRGEQRGSLDEAVRIFKEVLDQDPSYGPAHSGLCEAQWERYRQLANPELAKLAMSSCQRAAELSSDQVAVLVSVGRSYLEMGEWRRARTELERALTLEPDNAEAHRWSAWVAFGEGRPDEAEAGFRRAIEARPGLWVYHQEFGELLLNLGRNEQAADQFERAYRLTPQSYSAVNMLAVARSQLGQHEEAERLFQKSLELQPNPLAHRNLGYVRFRERRYDEAVGHLERATELLGETPYFNDWIVWDWLAHSYYWAGERPEAEQTWRRLIEVATPLYEVNPREANVLIFLSDAHAALGEFERARFYLSRLLALSSDLNYASYFIARTYEIMGDRELALSYIARAFQDRFDPLMIDSDPWLDDLRSEPEYQALRQQYMPSAA